MARLRRPDRQVDAWLAGSLQVFVGPEDEVIPPQRGTGSELRNTQKPLDSRHSLIVHTEML